MIFESISKYFIKLRVRENEDFFIMTIYNYKKLIDLIFE